MAIFFTIAGTNHHYSANITAVCADVSFLQDDDMYSEDEYLRMLVEFRKYAETKFDWTDYLTERRSIEDCFVSVVRNHHFPEEKMAEAIDEVVMNYCEFRIQERLDIAEQENYQGELPALADDDIDTVEMAYLFGHVSYLVEDEELCESIGVTYDYEQLHMCVWFSGQVTLGKGNYSRRVPNHSSKVTYNRLLNPYSLLWICTVLGEDTDIIRKAADEMESKDSFAGKCGVVRKYVPFSRIFELAKGLTSDDEEK